MIVSKFVIIGHDKCILANFEKYSKKMKFGQI